jgi:predicted acetyltransferase
MSEPANPTVTLVAVDETEYDDFFAMMGPYHEELDPYALEPEPWDAERGRTRILGNMDGRELLWIIHDGARAGFAMVRTLPDWGNESRMIAEIAEFYVLPVHRRTGVGRAAVEALLADHRRRGTALVEAGILRGNEPAIAFWATMGFEVEFLQTSRRP